MLPNLQRVAAAALILVLALTQFGTLNYHSLWNDEFITLRVLGLDYREIVRERFLANHMPGYFLFLKWWTNALGISDTTLRLPSAIFSFLGILLVWRLSARLYGESAGILALALTGLNQVHIEQGNNARMYSGLFLASAAALYSLVGFLDSGKRRFLIGLVAAGVFGFLLHMLHLFVPLAIGIYLLLRRRSFELRWRPALGAAALPLLLAIPLVIMWFAHQRKIGGSDELGRFALTDALRQTLMLLTGDYRPLEMKGAQYAGIALGLAALIIAGREAWLQRRVIVMPGNPFRYFDLFLIWMLTPACLIAIGQVFADTNIAGNWRYYIMAAAAGPPLLTGTAMLLRRRYGIGAAGWASVLFIAIVAANAAAFVASPGTGLREIALYIRDRRAPGDEIIVSRERNRTLTFIYYGGFGSIPDEVPEDVDAQDEVALWTHRQCAGEERVWGVFYDELRRDKLYRAMEKRDDLFEPLGEVVILGSTATRLYRVK